MIGVSDTTTPVSDGVAPGPIAAAIHRMLVTRGPLALEVLLAALEHIGMTLSEDDLDDLLDAGGLPTVIELDLDSGTVLVALDQLLLGRVFTHRLTAAEIAADVLRMEPDLEAIAQLTDVQPFDRLDDGSEFTDVPESDDIDPALTLGLPTGALDGYAPGDLVGLSLGVGGLHLAGVDTAMNVPNGMPERVAAAMDAGDEPVMLDSLLWRLCLDDPGLFGEPLPPVGDLLVAWGLEQFAGFVAPAGFDFVEWGAEIHGRHLAHRYQLDPDEALAVARMEVALEEILVLVEDRIERDSAEDKGERDSAEGAVDRQHRDEDAHFDDAFDRVIRALTPDLRFLAVPEVTEAILVETVDVSVQESLERFRAAAVTLGIVCEALAETAPRPVRAALRWLRGKTHERLGETLAAEAAFDECLTMNDRFGPALVDMARYAGDRGEAARAISLLQRAGLDDHSIAAGLRRYVPVDRQDVGRNDACWCGSGRKYKRCHLGKADLSLTDRARWLYAKAVTFALDPPYGAIAAELAAIHVANQDTDLLEAVAEPVVLDVALFDAHGLDAFLRVRGALLPEPEQLLAAQWLLVERSIYEVTAVDSGRGVSLRDIRTNEHHGVRDVALSGVCPDR